MPNYLTPGVYVEEVSTGTRSIQGVGTTTAAFVGRAPVVDAHLHEAVAINGWAHFFKEYTQGDSPGTALSRAVYGFFLNGGRRCFVVNVGDNERLVGGTRRREGLAVLEEVSEVAMVAAPGFSDPAAHDALLSHAEKMKDRIAILDAPEDVAMNGQPQRKNVSVLMLGMDGLTEVLQYNLLECWPCDWEAAAFDALSNQIAIARLVLTFESINRG